MKARGTPTHGVSRGVGRVISPDPHPFAPPLVLREKLLVTRPATPPVERQTFCLLVRREVRGSDLTVMGSACSRPGEVGSMPQEGSGSAAPMDAAAIEQVRTSSSARKPPLSSPERPVTPYDRRVVSHDASRPTPSTRSPLSAGTGSPMGLGKQTAVSESKTTSSSSSSARVLAAMRHGEDAWPTPTPIDPEETSNQLFEAPRRLADGTMDDGARTDKNDVNSHEATSNDSVIVYNLDGTVTNVHITPKSPGNFDAPSDAALQGLGSRLGSRHFEKKPISRGMIGSSRPESRAEPNNSETNHSLSRPTTTERSRVTAAHLVHAMHGVQTVLPVHETAEAPVENQFPSRPAAFEKDEDGLFSFRADDNYAGSSSDDEPEETLAMARERAKVEEQEMEIERRVNTVTPVTDEKTETTSDTEPDTEPEQSLNPGSVKKDSESISQSNIRPAPRLKMATFSQGPEPRPVSREANAMPLPPRRLGKSEKLSPLKPAVAERNKFVPVALHEPTTKAPLPEIIPKKKSPLEQELEAWGVSLPASPVLGTSPEHNRDDAQNDSDDVRLDSPPPVVSSILVETDETNDTELVLVSDEDDDLLAEFADDVTELVSGLVSTDGMANTNTNNRSPVLLPDLLAADVLDGSPLTASPLTASPMTASPLTASPLAPSPEKSQAESPTSLKGFSSADENVLPGGNLDPSRPSTADDEDETETLQWLRKTARDAELKLRDAKQKDSGGFFPLQVLSTQNKPLSRSGSLNSSPRGSNNGSRGSSPRELSNSLKAETIAAYGETAVGGAASLRRLRRKSKIPPPPSAALLSQIAKESSDTSGAHEGAETVAVEPTPTGHASNPKSKLPKLPPGRVSSVVKPSATAGTVRVVSDTAKPKVVTAAKSGARTRPTSTTGAGYSAAGSANRKLGAKVELPKVVSSRQKPVAGSKPSNERALKPPELKPSSKIAQKTSTPSLPSEDKVVIDGPVPSQTPTKLQKASKNGATETEKPELTKAEEARARLRGSRQRRSMAGVSGSVAGSVQVTSSKVGSTVPVVSASQPPSDPAASAAAAAKLASKLGSVSVMKPRSSTGTSTSDAEREQRAEKRAADAARRAEHAAAFAKAAAETEAAKALAAAAAREAAAKEAELRVHGMDEAEMVLRVGSLADEKTLHNARQAVQRMQILLDDVTKFSNQLKCEPQHVYCHVLHRLGLPVDRESRELQLEKLVGLETIGEMLTRAKELRNLLRIKVQDNNDLRLAQTALLETSGFFNRLDAFAQKKGRTALEVLVAQRNGGTVTSAV